MESPLNSINEEKESPVLSTSSTLPVIQDKIKIPITKTILFDKWTIFKIILVTLSLVALGLNTIYGFALPKGDVKCMEDLFFNITEPVNTYFANHPASKNALLIISSLFIDAMVLYGFYHWALYIRSWRIPLAIACFYLFRALIQQLLMMRFPMGYLWDYPGFPSIVVSYLRTNDFFFSGHVRFPIIFAYEWHKLNKKIFMYGAFLICVLEFITMVFLRGHYSIDLVSGLIYSHYTCIMIEPLAKFLDNNRFTRMLTREVRYIGEDDLNNNSIETNDKKVESV